MVVRTFVETIDKFIRPFIDRVIEAAREQQHMLQDSGVVISKSKGAYEEDLRQLDRELSGFVRNERSYLMLQDGLKLALDSLLSHPNFARYMAEMRRSGEYGYEEGVYGTVQEMLGLSDDLLSAFYDRGKEFFYDKKYEQAALIFHLLTHLNPFLFDPWLGLGICWEKNHAYFDAVYSYLMALLVNSNNPAPHLYCARCYIAIGEIHKARDAFELGESYITYETQHEYAHLVGDLKRLLS